MLPDVPTIAESGHKDHEVDAWYASFAPQKTPHQMVTQLVGWFTAATEVPEVEAKLAIQGLYPVGKCGTDEYGRVIREANIKAE